MFIGIDLGSNTLRALMMNEKYEKLKEAEFIIGSAHNLEQNGFISDAAIDKIKTALKELKEKGFELEKAQVGATAAFRKAENTQALFKDLYSDFGIQIRIISPKEEARLSILGMQNGLKKLDFKEKNLAYCDLGGASCELSFGVNLASFDFGIISFYEKIQKEFQSLKKQNFQFTKNIHKVFHSFEKLKDKKLKLILKLKNDFLAYMALRAFKEVQKAKKHLQKFSGKIIILNSGVPTTIASLKQNLHYAAYKASLINGTKLYRNDFLNYALKMHKMSEKEADFYLGKNRKKFLIAGCFLLFALFDKQKFIVLDEGLREGLCIEAQNKL